MGGGCHLYRWLMSSNFQQQCYDFFTRLEVESNPATLFLCFHSDGVWDPEKWHASLYPSSGRTSPVESFKKDLDSDRTSLMRRIVGECVLTVQESKLNISCWQNLSFGTTRMIKICEN